MVCINEETGTIFPMYFIYSNIFHFKIRVGFGDTYDSLAGAYGKYSMM